MECFIETGLDRTGSVTMDAPPAHQFFGLKSMALTTAATLALCSAIELANSFGPPMLDDLAGGFEPLADAAIRGDVAHVGGDLFLQLLRTST